MSEGTEVPWFSSPPTAMLIWDREEEDLGHLHFVDPEGKKAVVHVTHGAHTKHDLGFHVWHIEVSTGVATVSPSTHFVGSWHSPNPVQFRLVDSL